MIICKQTVKQIIFLCFLLPMNQMIPQCFQAILLGGKLIDPSALHMVEQEQRAQFPAIRSAMSNHFIDIMNVAFSNGKEVRCLFPAKEIVYKFMKPGSEPIILFAEVFGNHIDNVDTEAVHTFFDPEVHCVLHGLYKIGRAGIVRSIRVQFFRRGVCLVYDLNALRADHLVDISAVSSHDRRSGH